VETRDYLLQVGHVGLNVTDLERSKQFYTFVYGFRVAGESTDERRRYAFLGRDGKAMVTLWQQSGGQFAKHQPGLHHLAFEVEDVTVVKRDEDRVRSLGAKLPYEGVTTHSETGDPCGIFFEDPDGIRLESGVRAEKQCSPRAGTSACGFF